MRDAEGYWIGRSALNRGACRYSLPAMIWPFQTDPGWPAKSETTPPASLTISMPGATSQGLRPASQTAS